VKFLFKLLQHVVLLLQVHAYALSNLDNRLRFLCLPSTPRPACLSSIRWVFAGAPQDHNAQVKRKPNIQKCLLNLSQ